MSLQIYRMTISESQTAPGLRSDLVLGMFFHKTSPLPALILFASSLF